MFSYATDERFPADEAQLAVPDRDHGGRARQPVDDREFSDDRAWAKNRQYPLVTLRRSDADLEQALPKPIASIGESPPSNSTSLSVSDRGFAFAKTPSKNWIGRLGNMPEKLRLGTPVVLLLAFGESFCAAMDEQSFRKTQNPHYFDSYHRRTPRRLYKFYHPGFCCSLPGLEWRRLARDFNARRRFTLIGVAF